VNAIETGATIGGLLRECGLPRLEAELLLCSVLGCERAWLIAHAEETIDSPDARSAHARFARRRANRFLHYGLAGVLRRGTRGDGGPDPRPETERLVECTRAPAPRCVGARAGADRKRSDCHRAREQRPGLWIVADIQAPSPSRGKRATTGLISTLF
jgi:methylase of polypeptide subunit release factors